MDVADKLKGIDFPSSYLTNVIYDDDSLTLELDWALLPDHPRYEPPKGGEDGCYRPGFIRFADIADLRLARSASGEDLSIINSVDLLEDRVVISSGWGEIEVTARSIRVALD